MSLLHQSSEDDDAAAGHADAGLRKALNHIQAVKLVLLRTLPHLPPELQADAVNVLQRSHYAEHDDGIWRLDSKVTSPR